ncbi:aminoglycoside 6'-N-acetyltransferase [Arsenicibacter rosenii]|uniref:Aminoglycoside N(6')-acetyltransferase type 1 n=1 Tax=Arsenicibacter rosenii TaxID=1750698 RepID=A0A1S2VHN3_9BACT|nr:aminoglycoside 6'-N-acetyltransferase [Arsenicibacter rosenii]OIN57378.1 GNAT family N-acetyltransferase [Arsenicibacter rosenii]
MTINRTTEADLPDWTRLALELWPDDDEMNEMGEILRQILASPTQDGFIVRNDQNEAIGFMDLSLRTDYVPGATASPVAFLEGIYVRPAYQHQGIGYALIRQAEAWAREHGCSELASDVTFGNAAGELFHRKAGFEEVERVIQYIKPI